MSRSTLSLVLALLLPSCNVVLEHSGATVGQGSSLLTNGRSAEAIVGALGVPDEIRNDRDRLVLVYRSGQRERRVFQLSGGLKFLTIDRLSEHSSSLELVFDASRRLVQSQRAGD